MTPLPEGVSMVGEQNPQDIRELTAWLQADDAKSRAMRATRLRDLLDILPVSSDGLSFLGGEQSVLCFEEIRRCYLDRSDMAVVLLCLAYVERELAAQLYAAGWNRAKKASLVKVLERAYKDGVLSELEWRTYAELGHCATRTPTSARPALLAIRQFPALGPTLLLTQNGRRSWFGPRSRRRGGRA